MYVYTYVCTCAHQMMHKRTLCVCVLTLNIPCNSSIPCISIAMVVRITCVHVPTYVHSYIRTYMYVRIIIIFTDNIYICTYVQ